MSAPVTTRSRWIVWGGLVGVLVVLALIGLLVASALRSPVKRGAFDPAAPTPGGSRALAVLLGQHGHRVAKVASAGDALEKAGGGNVTVLVPFPYNLSTKNVQKLAALPVTDRVVMVAPDSYTAADLHAGLSVDEAGTLEQVEQPGCDLPEAASAGDVDLGGLLYSSSEPGSVSCYKQSLTVLNRENSAQLVLLGSGDLLTNDALADNGNAALALGLLTAHQDVVWLQQTTVDADAEGASGTSLVDLLPGWIPATTWMLVAAAVLAACWRGRRLSAPVSEPLPVIVRSTETVEGRARLYQRAKARPEAAAALREAALAKLRPLLGFGYHAEPMEVRNAAAERSGWPADAIAGLLYGPPPADDRALVELADGLDALIAAITTTGKNVPADEGTPS